MVKLKIKKSSNDEKEDLSNKIVEFNAQLIKKVEEEAFQQGCHLVHLDIFDFQAKDFYLKQGYKVFGELDDCPPGHKRFYLRKYLK